MSCAALGLGALCEELSSMTTYRGGKSIFPPFVLEIKKVNGKSCP